MCINRKNVSVFDVLPTTPPLNMSFRRALVDDKWDVWSHLCIRLMDVRLEGTNDHFAWSLTASKEFTVKPMYEDLMNDQARYLHKYLWKLKIPLKIKVFM